MSDVGHSRSGEGTKAHELREATGAGPSSVTEGGKAEAPTEGEGHPKPAASVAHEEGALDGRTSPATVGKTGKKQAETTAHLTKEQHGRGRRKGEERDG